jgi:hypothetical protein
LLKLEILDASVIWRCRETRYASFGLDFFLVGVSGRPVPVILGLLKVAGGRGVLVVKDAAVFLVRLKLRNQILWA